MTARFLIGDVFDGLATIPDGSVDLVVSSPPFLALRSYLPADHPLKDKEIGSEPTPAAFLDVMLKVTAELRRVLAPHGSIALELGDTYAGSGGAGGDYDADGLREGQPRYKASDAQKNARIAMPDGRTIQSAGIGNGEPRKGEGWPLAKSKTLIPELFRIALAYGFNPLTGEPSPAGQWRVRNVVTWCRPNPPVGALGDKWRPATSDVVVACVSGKRYWDDLATRKPWSENTGGMGAIQQFSHGIARDVRRDLDQRQGRELPVKRDTHGGAPLLDYWEIPPTGYAGSHYAVYPPALVVPLVKAMTPERVCRTCGEPSRRIVETTNAVGKGVHVSKSWTLAESVQHRAAQPDLIDRNDPSVPDYSEKITLGFTDCGHDDWRPGLVLDPFAGSGTTLLVAQGHGHDTVGIDLDSRNADLARERVGPMFLQVEEA